MALMSKCVFPSGTRSMTVSHRVGGRSKPNNTCPPPMAARFRLDTTSLRSLYNQQIDGSKRSLRSVEDFSEFEQRTAYFNGDHVSATRKGVNLPNRPNQVAMMAQMQDIIDFPIEPVGTRVWKIAWRRFCRILTTPGSRRGRGI